MAHLPIKTPKGTELPMSDIKGQKYLQVAYRLVWFREEHPTWSISTEIIEWDREKKWIVIKAHIIDDNNRMIAEALKTGSAANFPMGYIEKAETGAIGRALAMCGYGTQFEPEFDEGEQLADAPLEVKTPSVMPKFNANNYPPLPTK
jgi:hypothetical protein